MLALIDLRRFARRSRRGSGTSLRTARSPTLSFWFGSWKR
jgi:hypothetical protein